MVSALLARLWPFSTGGRDEADPADPVADDLSELDEADLEADDEDDEQIRTWDFISSWQYDGWQAHTGGHTIDEQEKALAEIQARAEAIEEAEEAATEAAAEAVATEADLPDHCSE